MGLNSWLCWLLLGALLGWLAHWLLDWWRLGGIFSGFRGRIGNLETKLRDANADLGASRNRLDLRNSEYGKLESETVDLRSRTGLIPQLESEVSDLRLKLGELDSTKSKLGNLESELVTLRGKLADAEPYEVKFNAANAELDGLRSKLTAAEPFEGKFKHVEGELNSLRESSKRELNDLSIKLSDAEGAQERLKASLDVSVRELGDLRAKLRKVDELQLQLEQAQAAQGEVQELLGARDDELNRLRNELGEAHTARDRLASFEPELGLLRERISNFEIERDEAQAAIQARNQELEGVRGQLNELENLRADIGTLRGELDRASVARNGLEKSNAELAARIKQLEGENARIAALEAQAGRIGGLESRIRELEGQAGRIPDLEARASRVAGLEAEAGRVGGLELRIRELEDELNSLKSAKRDDLTKINGIGQVFATRLNQAGINTFEQLNATDSDHISEIIKPEEWQKIDPDLWRSEAAYYARGEKPPKREKAPDRLARINGVGDVYERKLHDAGIHTFAELAAANATRISEVTGASETEANLWITEADALAHGKRGTRDRERLVRGRLSSAEDELARLRTELARRPTGARRDLFEDLPVIGEAYQRRLYGAGIFTFEELAALSKAQLQEIIGVEGLDYEQVLREAGKAARGEAFGERAGRRRRRRDSLERINGIGVVYQRKLFEASVFTFEDLVAAGPHRLYEIIENDLEFGPWIEEARKFADSEGQYRDHLEKVDGIGQVYQQRLFEANVFTFEDLAALSDERIHDIVQPGDRNIEPDKWKAEALELAKTSPKNLED